MRVGNCCTGQNKRKQKWEGRTTGILLWIWPLFDPQCTRTMLTPLSIMWSNICTYNFYTIIEHNPFFTPPLCTFLDVSVFSRALTPNCLVNVSIASLIPFMGQDILPFCIVLGCTIVLTSWFFACMLSDTHEGGRGHTHQWLCNFAAD